MADAKVDENVLNDKQESIVKTDVTSVETMENEQKWTCWNIRQPDFFKIEKRLLKYKGFFFFFSGAIGSVCSYFSIYYKQLGFSPKQIGVISGIRPFVGVWTGPIGGMLADRFRIKRIILMISTVAWLAFVTSIGFVGPAKFSPDCDYVNTMKTENKTSGQQSPFSTLHTKSSTEELLQESRGWMFDQGDLHSLFVTVILLVTLGEIFQAPAGALADSGCVEELGTDGIHKYGHQRAWGSLSPGITSLVVGAIVSTTRTTIRECGVDVTFSNYRIGFYFFAMMMTCCCVTTCFFKFQEQKKDKNEGKPKPNPLKLFRMFCTIHYGSWLFSMFFTGICNGVIWGFLFWHIENIGGSQLVIGLSNTICCLSETLMFFLIFPILEKTGCLLFMGVGFFGYAIRFSVFAIMENPWILLPFEVLQGFTFAGIWSVYIKYLCANVPKEYMGTLQGFLHGIYWGLGSGTGGMLGGVLVQTWGARVTFWIFSIASFINMILFLLIQKTTAKPDVFENYEKIADD